MWWVWDENRRSRTPGKCPEPGALEENEAESREIKVRVSVGFPTQIEAFWKSERFKRSLYRTSCELAQSQTLRFAKNANTSGGGRRSNQSKAKFPPAKPQSGERGRFFPKITCAPRVVFGTLAVNSLPLTKERMDPDCAQLMLLDLQRSNQGVDPVKRRLKGASG